MRRTEATRTRRLASRASVRSSSVSGRRQRLAVVASRQVRGQATVCAGAPALAGRGARAPGARPAPRPSHPGRRSHGAPLRSGLRIGADAGSAAAPRRARPCRHVLARQPHADRAVHRHPAAGRRRGDLRPHLGRRLHRAPPGRVRPRRAVPEDDRRQVPARHRRHARASADRVRHGRSPFSTRATRGRPSRCRSRARPGTRSAGRS